jgi:P2-related tail formation protein
MLDLDIARLTPRFLMRDTNGGAISRAIEAGLKGFLASAREGVAIATDSDKMPAWRLDELAREKRIAWYDFAADVEVKRAVVKAWPRSMRHLGTPGVIEDVAAKYFGDAVVEEWWQYGAEPFYFRLYTANVRDGSRNAALVAKLVDAIKNVRSIFDGVFFEAASGNVGIRYAAATQIAHGIRMEVE